MVISSCEGVKVNNVVSEDAYTDGLYIIHSNDVVINDFKAYRSGRQGCSIISGMNIIIRDCLFDGAYRFAPMSGLDIEPNLETDELDNITIEKCSFTNNAASGLTLFLKTKNTNSPCNITVHDCIFSDNGFNIAVSSAPNSGSGIIDIGNCKLRNSKGVGFQSKCYSAVGTPKVVFHDSTIENANTGGGRDVREQATLISVHNVSSKPVQSNYGNIEFRDLRLKQDRSHQGSLRRAINIYPDSQFSVSEVRVSGITYYIERKDDKSFKRLFTPGSKSVNVIISD